MCRGVKDEYFRITTTVRNTMSTINPVDTARHVAWMAMRDRRRATTLTAAVAASMLAVLAMPASADNMQVSGIGVFNDLCQPPVGSPPSV